MTWPDVDVPPPVQRWAHLLGPDSGAERPAIVISDSEHDIDRAVAAYPWPPEPQFARTESLIGSLHRQTYWWPAPGSYEVRPGYWVAPVLRAASSTYLETLDPNGDHRG